MFRFAITKFNLMTPGREDMDVEETSALSAAGDDKFAAVAAAVLAAVGGKEKGKTVDCCATACASSSAIPLWSTRLPARRLALWMS